MKRLVFVILVVFSLAVAANAQTFRGAINGTVTDPSGAVVPNATVKATETATGIDHSTTTTSDGAFAFQDLPLGFYKVTVTATGFPAYTVDKVQVVAGQIYTFQVKLVLSPQPITVEVFAAALTLYTTTTTQTTTISRMSYKHPLNGRDFTQMIGVTPGFGGYNVGGFGSLNGTRPSQINWQISRWTITTSGTTFSHQSGWRLGDAGTVLPIDATGILSADISDPKAGAQVAQPTLSSV
jgi:hypothetical protein